MRTNDKRVFSTLLTHKKGNFFSVRKNIRHVLPLKQKPNVPGRWVHSVRFADGPLFHDPAHRLTPAIISSTSQAPQNSKS